MRCTALHVDKALARRLPRLPAVLVAIVCATSAHAQLPEPTDLVNQQHCLFCHTADKDYLAPSFHEIAKRYRKTPDAQVMLEQKLRLGGRSHWGNIPMPMPEDRGSPLSPEDAHTLVQWVLSQ